MKIFKKIVFVLSVVLVSLSAKNLQAQVYVTENMGAADSWIYITENMGVADCWLSESEFTSSYIGAVWVYITENMGAADKWVYITTTIGSSDGVECLIKED